MNRQPLPGTSSSSVDEEDLRFEHLRLIADLDARFRAPLMSFFFRRTGNRQDAEDLTQETFIRLLGSKKLNPESYLPAYVFKVSTNLLKDRHRRNEARKRKPADDQDAVLINHIAEKIAEEIEPERVLIGKQSLGQVYRCLEKLDEKTRNIFILYRLEGMKQKEIAALLGLGLSTVEKHCMIAMASLAACFPKEGQ